MTQQAEHPELIEAVRRGAELLDRRRPRWALEVNTEELDMGSCADCIFGQLFGRFRDGCDQMGVSQEDVYEAARLGFDLPTPPKWSFDDMAAAWRTEITRRLEAKP